MARARTNLHVAEQRLVRRRSTCLLFGTGAGRDLELTIDPRMVGQAPLGFYILIVLILWTPIPLDIKKFDWYRRAIQDMVN